MSFIHKFLKIDPIVTEILKAGIITYKKHYKAYLLLNIVYIIIFAFIMGLTSSLEAQLYFFTKVFDYVNSFQIYTQTLFFYGFLGLLITVITYYITFRKTLSSGELGLEIDAQWKTLTHFVIIFGYNFIVILYLIIWVLFCEIIFSLFTLNRFQIITQSDYAFIFISLMVCIFLVIVLFLFVVKTTYYIYMLDESKVPTQALDPIIFSLGAFYGILVLILEIINFYFPIALLANISTIITYLSPGTILMPVLGYSMAHLKVAQTILGFEPLFVKEDASPN